MGTLPQPMQSWMAHLSALWRLMNLPTNLFRPSTSLQISPSHSLTLSLIFNPIGIMLVNELPPPSQASTLAITKLQLLALPSQNSMPSSPNSVS